MRPDTVPRTLRWLQSMADHVPSKCSVCHSWPSQRICNACVARFAQPEPRCKRCALKVPAGVEICGACIVNPPLFDTCLAAVDYAFPWASTITDFKFRADLGLARVLVTLLRSTPWVEPALESADRVLPVPLSTQRIRTRGFNQAALLARRLAGNKADLHTLLRLQHADNAQSLLPRADRLRSLKGAFAIEPSRASGLRGEHVILIDDVMTTGATAQAATLALREAGVAQITVVVLARTEARGASSRAD